MDPPRFSRVTTTTSSSYIRILCTFSGLHADLTHAAFSSSLIFSIYKKKHKTKHHVRSRSMRLCMSCVSVFVCVCLCVGVFVCVCLSVSISPVTAACRFACGSLTHSLTFSLSLSLPLRATLVLLPLLRCATGLLLYFLY